MHRSIIALFTAAAMLLRVRAMARRSDHTRSEIRELLLDAARHIIIEEGVSAISARKVTDAIGYTVGTLYLVFANMDDLMQAVNARTLDALYEAAKEHADPSNASDSLMELAESFLQFAGSHKAEWDAIINYQYSASHEWSDYYTTRVESLIGLIAASTNALYSEAEAELQATEIRVLWCGLYGIFSLSSSDRLGDRTNAREMVAALARMFLASRHGSGSA